MTISHAGESALSDKSRPEPTLDGANTNAYDQVQELRRTSEKSNWTPITNAEPAQLIMTDPFADVAGARDFLKNGISKECKAAGTGAKPGDCDFKPDFEFKTEGAKKWRQESMNQKSKEMKTDSDGNYQVQKGDSVWGMAERMARENAGRKPSSDETLKAMNKLLEANKERYPGLDCNPHMLRPGMKLEIPGARDRQAQRSEPRTDSGETETTQGKHSSEEGMNLADKLDDRRADFQQEQRKSNRGDVPAVERGSNSKQSAEFGDDAIVLKQSQPAESGDNVMVQKNRELQNFVDDRILLNSGDSETDNQITDLPPMFGDRESAIKPQEQQKRLTSEEDELWYMNGGAMGRPLIERLDDTTYGAAEARNATHSMPPLTGLYN